MKENPKALNLEKIRHATKKVTLGFKVDPSLKIELAEKAAALKLNLSQYVEKIVNQAKKYEEKIMNGSFPNPIELNRQKKEIELLKNEIAQYSYRINQFRKERDFALQQLDFFQSNPKLKYIFNLKKGEVVNLGNQSIKIRTLNDVFLIIINSFKILKHD